MKRAGVLLGIGAEYVYEADTDPWSVTWIRVYPRSTLFFYSSGRVSVSDIEEKILRCQRLGLSVFLIGITAGTTVLGAFDPIEEVAALCQKYRIWLHVDVSNRTLSTGSIHLARMTREHGVVQHCSHRKPNTFFKASTSKTCSPVQINSFDILYCLELIRSHGIRTNWCPFICNVRQFYWNNR